MEKTTVIISPKEGKLPFDKEAADEIKNALLDKLGRDRFDVSILNFPADITVIGEARVPHLEIRNGDLVATMKQKEPENKRTQATIEEWLKENTWVGRNGNR